MTTGPGLPRGNRTKGSPRISPESARPEKRGAASQQQRGALSQGLWVPGDPELQGKAARPLSLQAVGGVSELAGPPCFRQVQGKREKRGHSTPAPARQSLISWALGAGAWRRLGLGWEIPVKATGICKEDRVGGTV